MASFYVNANIAQASTIHTDVYNHPQYFELAKECIFANSWQFAGNAQMVPQPGDIFPFTMLDGYLNEPLLLTNNQQGQLHCLSNVCTHRGNLVAYEPCSKVNQLRCKYHGRLFELNGQFKSMPEFKEVENFPCATDHLTQLPIFNWGNLLFTTLSQSTDPAPFLGDMMQRLHWLPLHEFTYRPEYNRTFTVAANWALYCENYLEGFHIPFVHADLNAALSFGDYTTELFAKSNLQLGVSKAGDHCFDLPATSVDYGQSIAAYYFWVYPNMMFNFYPWGLSINIVTPLASDKTRVEFLTYIWKEELYEKGAGSNLDKVEEEDEEIVQMVQKGIQSRFYQQGRYSVTREQGTHHFHQLLAASFNQAGTTA